MRIDVLTLFPEMFSSVLGASILKRAIDAGHIEVGLFDIRNYADNKHKRVDDYVFGGGTGLLMMPQPIFDALADISPKGESHVVYMSPQGRTLTDKTVRRLAEYPRLTILCGHYEGVDQRVIDELIDEEISIGDYVLTGGELPAMVLIDAVSRQLPGVLGNELGASDESFADGLLECPQYTRPADFRGRTVPDVLISGHYANIVKWRRQKSLEATFKKRRDLLDDADLTADERKMVEQWRNEEGGD